REGGIKRPLTVQWRVERAVAEGPLAPFDDRPRPGRALTITLEPKAWLVSLACRKAKDLGYPHDVWTIRLLAQLAPEHGPARGHACLANLVQGTVCKNPGRGRGGYYLEQRDPDFAEGRGAVRLSSSENPQAGGGIEDETASRQRQSPALLKARHRSR